VNTGTAVITENPPKWLGEPVTITTFQGSVPEIRGLIPHFDRRLFGLKYPTGSQLPLIAPSGINELWDMVAVNGISRDQLLDFEIFAPIRSEQTKIAEILSTVDRAIEQTKALIAKQQSVKTGLMQDLLTRGIDENGNLRSEQTHSFKDSSLDRIPVDWNVKRMDEIADVSYGISDSIDRTNRTGVPTITLPCVSPGGA
jgi:restriction endonuclease S subunit